MRRVILSDLQSPDDNPNGYGASAAGTAFSAILLAAVFHSHYGENIPRWGRRSSSVHFNNHRLLTSLAFWEWALCVECGGATSTLEVLSIFQWSIRIPLPSGASRLPIRGTTTRLSGLLKAISQQFSRCPSPL